MGFIDKLKKGIGRKNKEKSSKRDTQKDTGLKRKSPPIDKASFDGSDEEYKLFESIMSYRDEPVVHSILRKISDDRLLIEIGKSHPFLELRRDAILKIKHASREDLIELFDLNEDRWGIGLRNAIASKFTKEQLMEINDERKLREIIRYSNEENANCIYDKINDEELLIDIVCLTRYESIRDKFVERFKNDPEVMRRCLESSRSPELKSKVAQYINNDKELKKYILSQNDWNNTVEYALNEMKDEKIANEALYEFAHKGKNQLNKSIEFMSDDETLLNIALEYYNLDYDRYYFEIGMALDRINDDSLLVDLMHNETDETLRRLAAKYIKSEEALKEFVNDPNENVRKIAIRATCKNSLDKFMDLFNNDEIILDDHFILDGDGIYETITINRDNVTIDGKNHKLECINPKIELRIEANNFSIKNIETNMLIRLNEGSLNISNSIIDKSIEINEGNLTGENSTFDRRIKNINGSLNLTDCNIDQIFNESSLSLKGCIIGSIKNDDSCNIDNCTINEFLYNNGRCKIENSKVESASRNYSNPYDGGGAISNGQNASMELTKCILAKNSTDKNGGVIRNIGSINLYDCIFEDNKAGLSGGAIFNEGRLTASRCKFKNNLVEFPRYGSFSRATGRYHFIKHGNSILNLAFMDLFNCQFITDKINDAPEIIAQFGKDSYLNIENCQFSTNKKTSVDAIEGGLNFNNAKFKVSFDDVEEINLANEGPEETGSINKNLKETSSTNEGLKERRSTNKGLKETSSINKGEETTVSSKNEDIDAESILENFKGFEYLDDLINDGSSEITLDCNIQMHELEQAFYEGGIEIYEDNLTIDGQYHTIDANNLSRIFHITGNGIVIKNIKFKNGYYYQDYFDNSKDGGGVLCITHSASAKIINCEFSNNESRQSGGVVKNNSDSLEIIDSNFRDNKVIYQKGGCIINNASLTLRNCSFKNNFSNAGSCVFNSEDSSLKIFDCEFNNNTSRKDFEAGGVRFSLEVPSSGGAIANEGSL
ncbi:adhesin-like protein [Methanobrevibacter ruminantium M1]|uniref:Adhesin-like protein n=1 Tax=Methanobrevibacter ruminantium (strain ATCC 35063 / DSM 1093 / JCM 13430 / OCM 146 / M1) TaxID=634498 RepID=D3E4K4_METRM|nr:HEAT repeat domain-containing protein [Methanobrevibacter ruminantium]ADC45900.1 adhesin-like protein [Methanobrevibacter ruminantium M1]